MTCSCLYLNLRIVTTFHLAHFVEDTKGLEVIWLVARIVEFHLEFSFKFDSRETKNLFVALQRWESVYAQAIDVYIFLGYRLFDSKLDY